MSIGPRPDGFPQGQGGYNSDPFHDGFDQSPSSTTPVSPKNIPPTSEVDPTQQSAAVAATSPVASNKAGVAAPVVPARPVSRVPQPPPNPPPIPRRPSMERSGDLAGVGAFHDKERGKISTFGANPSIARGSSGVDASKPKKGGISDQELPNIPVETLNDAQAAVLSADAAPAKGVIRDAEADRGDLSSQAQAHPSGVIEADFHNDAVEEEEEEDNLDMHFHEDVIEKDVTVEHAKPKAVPESPHQGSVSAPAAAAHNAPISPSTSSAEIAKIVAQAAVRNTGRIAASRAADHADRSTRKAAAAEAAAIDAEAAALDAEADALEVEDAEIRVEDARIATLGANSPERGVAIAAYNARIAVFTARNAAHNVRVAAHAGTPADPADQLVLADALKAKIATHDAKLAALAAAEAESQRTPLNVTSDALQLKAQQLRAEEFDRNMPRFAKLGEKLQLGAYYHPLQDILSSEKYKHISENKEILKAIKDELVTIPIPTVTSMHGEYSKDAKKKRASAINDIIVRVIEQYNGGILSRAVRKMGHIAFHMLVAIPGLILESLWSISKTIGAKIESEIELFIFGHAFMRPIAPKLVLATRVIKEVTGMTTAEVEKSNAAREKDLLTECDQVITQIDQIQTQGQANFTRQALSSFLAEGGEEFAHTYVGSWEYKGNDPYKKENDPYKMNLYYEKGHKHHHPTSLRQVEEAKARLSNRGEQLHGAWKDDVERNVEGNKGTFSGTEEELRSKVELQLEDTQVHMVRKDREYANIRFKRRSELYHSLQNDTLNRVVDSHNHIVAIYRGKPGSLSKDDAGKFLTEDYRGGLLREEPISGKALASQILASTEVGTVAGLLLMGPIGAPIGAIAGAIGGAMERGGGLISSTPKFETAERFFRADSDAILRNEDKDKTLLTTPPPVTLADKIKLKQFLLQIVFIHQADAKQANIHSQSLDALEAKIKASIAEDMTEEGLRKKEPIPNAMSNAPMSPAMQVPQAIQNAMGPVEALKAKRDQLFARLKAGIPSINIQDYTTLSSLRNHLANNDDEHAVDELAAHAPNELDIDPKTKKQAIEFAFKELRHFVSDIYRDIASNIDADPSISPEEKNELKYKYLINLSPQAVLQLMDDQIKEFKERQPAVPEPEPEVVQSYGPLQKPPSLKGFNPPPSLPGESVLKPEPEPVSAPPPRPVSAPPPAQHQPRDESQPPGLVMDGGRVRAPSEPGPEPVLSPNRPLRANLREAESNLFFARNGDIREQAVPSWMQQALRPMAASLIKRRNRLFEALVKNEVMLEEQANKPLAVLFNDTTKGIQSTTSDQDRMDKLQYTKNVLNRFIDQVRLGLISAIRSGSDEMNKEKWIKAFKELSPESLLRLIDQELLKSETPTFPEPEPPVEPELGSGPASEPQPGPVASPEQAPVVDPKTAEYLKQQKPPRIQGPIIPPPSTKPEQPQIEGDSVEL